MIFYVQFIFRPQKSFKEKLNILRVVPMKTLLDQTADFLIYFSPAVAVQDTTPGDRV